MDHILIIVGMVLGGLLIGSFAGAQVWRLRARQLVEDKEAKEDYDKKEYKQLVSLTKHKGSDDRSRCLSCQHQLAWFDLVPLASWLSTGGKCRYCHVSIGWFEPLIELGLASFFVLSFVLWPQPLTTSLDIAQFVLWLVAGVLLTILFAYDFKWFLLPNVIMFPLIGVAGVFAVIEIVQSVEVVVALASLIGAIFILSGIYLLLWLASKGAWIGFGDVKLGLALALLLGSWELAFLGLFLANLIGCLIVLPGLITKKLSRTTQVPFGPMLIAGCIIAALVGQRLIDGYFSLSTSLLM